MHRFNFARLPQAAVQEVDTHILARWYMHIIYGMPGLCSEAARKFNVASGRTRLQRWAWLLAYRFFIFREVLPYHHQLLLQLMLQLCPDNSRVLQTLSQMFVQRFKKLCLDKQHINRLRSIL